MGMPRNLESNTARLFTSRSLDEENAGGVPGCESRVISPPALFPCSVVVPLLEFAHIVYHRLSTQNKKADAIECPEAFHHVGLLVNEPPGHGRAAL